MKKLLLAVALTVVPAVLYGQAIPTSKFAWNQEAPTLADAQNYTYKYYDNGSTTPQTLIGVTCTGTTSPFACQAPFPAFTPGNHSVTLTASNIAGESPKTSPLDFTFIVSPASPTNFRIIGG